MLGRSAHWEVPRRVVVYYLLFCTIVLGWLLASAVIVSQASMRHNHEAAFLSYLGRAAAETTISYLETEGTDLQKLVERFAREQSLLYCAVVSPEGNYVAHTVRQRVGKPKTEPTGQHLRWGTVDAVRCRTGTNVFREYRTPLEAGGRTVGTLLMGVREVGWWSALRLTAEHAPLALAGPGLFVLVGAVVLSRVVRPMAAIDAQLRDAAIAPTLADTRLQTVKYRTPSALGWNRLIRHFEEESQGGSLDHRLNQALQSLRRDKVDEVLNSLADGVAVTDAEGRVTFANQALEAILASDAAAGSLVGAAMEDRLGLPAQSPALRQFLDPALHQRLVVQEISWEREGVQQTLRLARSPIRSTGQNHPGGFVWSVRDVTQQRLAEKMRNQFLDSATHELRTPLANIRAYAETLSLSDLIEVERQKEFCNTINMEATRLSRFIDDLLSVSSMEMGALSLTRQDVDLERLFREVVSKVKPQMDQKRISFHCVLPEKFPAMPADKDKLTVALVNLLGNAAKYTPDGGRVGLKVKVIDRRLFVDVEDTGVGISEDELPRVFDKFFRSADPQVREQTGSGLGLTLAQEVIRLHGGELIVESQLGVGSKFTAMVPLD